MNRRLPEYIGFPGKQYTVSGANDPMEFENQMLQTLQIAELRPVVPKITKDLNIYAPDPDKGWNDIQSYIKANKISLDSSHYQMKGFKVVLSNIVPLTETYTNDYGESELFGGLQNMASGGARELFQMADVSDGEKYLKELKEEGGLLGTVAGGVNDAIDAVAGVAGRLTKNDEIRKDLSFLMKNPTHKISIPLMWKGCSFQASYQITTRLYCYNPGNDDLYAETILAPLAILMMFALPRSASDGKFYFTPFMMDFKIPGQVHIPMGFCNGLDVIKGGDINDISWVKRPGTVDVRMTIGSVYGVKTNSLKRSETSFSPTIMDELSTLCMIDNTDQNIDSTLDESSLTDSQRQEIEDSRNRPYGQDTESAIEELMDK